MTLEDLCKCEDGHELIYYDGEPCPLCSAISEVGEKDDEISNRQSEIEELQTEIQGLKDQVAEQE